MLKLLWRIFTETEEPYYTLDRQLNDLNYSQARLSC